MRVLSSTTNMDNAKIGTLDYAEIRDAMQLLYRFLYVQAEELLRVQRESDPMPSYEAVRAAERLRYTAEDLERTTKLLEVINTYVEV